MKTYTLPSARKFHSLLNALLIFFLIIPAIGTNPVSVVASSAVVSPAEVKRSETLPLPKISAISLPEAAGPAFNKALFNQSDRKIEEQSQPVEAAPLMFIENTGQFDAGVKFLVSNASNLIHLTENEFWISILEKPEVRVERGYKQIETSDTEKNQNVKEEKARKGAHLRYTFENANPHPVVEGFNPIDAKVSYYLSNDPNAWRANASVWGGVRYIDLYPGVNLEVTSENGDWVWQFVPNTPENRKDNNPSDNNSEQMMRGDANLQGVQFRIEGANTIEVTDGGYTARTDVGDVVLPPLQVITDDNARNSIPLIASVNGDIVELQSSGATEVRETLAAGYSSASNSGASEHTVLSLVHSAFIGGETSNGAGYWEWPSSIGTTIDSAGSVYIFGKTWEVSFPAKPGAYLETLNDLFIAKLNADLTDLVYLTYVGGSGADYKGEGEAIDVDSTGALYVAGFTQSQDFPAEDFPGTDPSTYGYKNFIFKLNSAGEKDYAYFFGHGRSADIKVTSQDEVIFLGESSLQLTESTSCAWADITDWAIVAQLIPDENGLHLGFLTHIRGEDNNGEALLWEPRGFDIGVNGHIFVLGSYDGDHLSTGRLDPDGNCVFANTVTLDGGQSNDYYDIKVGPDPDDPTQEFAYVVGDTTYSEYALLVKLDAENGELVFQNSIGGNDYSDPHGFTWGNGIDVDGDGSVYITGLTSAPDFPITADAYLADCGTCGVEELPDSMFIPHSAGFFTKLSPDGEILYSTFLGLPYTSGGNVHLDGKGGVYLTGGLNGNENPGTLPIPFFQDGYYSENPNTSTEDTRGIFVVKFEGLPVFPVRTGYSGGEGPKGGGGDPRECALNCSDGSVQPGRGDPVNTYTGGFDYSLVDLSVETIAGPLTFQRSYSSAANDLYTDLMGIGWTHNQDIYLITEDQIGGEQGEVWFKAHSNNQYNFIVNEDGSFSPYAGVLASLTENLDGYYLTTSSQETYTFDLTTKKLLHWRDANGHGFDYIYQDGRLNQVTEPEGQRYLQFIYDSIEPYRLISVKDHTQREVSLGYEDGEDLRLVEYFSPQPGHELIGQWGYVYDTGHRITEIYDANTTRILQNVYDAEGRVFQQYDGKDNLIIELAYQGRSVAVKYSPTGPVETFVYGGRNTAVAQIDLFGMPTSSVVDINFRPWGTVDPLGNATKMLWSEDGANLTGITDALKYETTMEYNDQNNLTAITDAAGNLTEYTYDGNLLLDSTQTVGNEASGFYTVSTNYEYTDLALDFTDAALTINEPLNLLKLITSPDGQATFYEYNAQGEMCKSIQNAQAIASDAVLRESINCDSSEAGVADLLVTRYGYDNLGRLKSVISSEGVTNTTCYDNADRVARTVTSKPGMTVPANVCDATFVSSADHRATDTRYDAVGNAIAIIENPNAGAAQRVTRTYYDSNNRSIATVQNLKNWGIEDPTPPSANLRTDIENLTTETVYDDFGNVIATIAPDGVISRTYYDAANRPVYVTQNLVGQDLDQSITTPPGYVAGNYDQNISSRTIYDAAGNVIATVPLSLDCTFTDDDQGNLTASEACRVTRTYYDALNRPIAVVQNLRGQAITDPTIPAFGTADQNIRSDTYYDAVGNAIATVVARGPGCAVTTDAQGNVTASQDCSVARTYYDSLGRPEFFVQNLVGMAINTDAYVNGVFTLNDLDRDPQQNLITQTVYDDAGKVIASIFYDYDPLNPTADCQVTYISGRATTFTDLCIVTRNYYDAQGRTIQTVQHLVGASIQVPVCPVYTQDFPDRNVPGATPVYDAQGRTIASIDPLNRINRTYFDAWGRAFLSVRNLTAQAVQVTTPPTGQVYDAADPKDVPSAQTYYDSEGRAYASQDALGHITRSYFDVLGRTVYTTRNLTGQSLDESYTTPPPHDPGYPDQNITTQTIYDRAGRTIASVFYRAGCMVTQEGGQFVANEHCIVTRMYYDGLGRTVATVQNAVESATNAPEQNVRHDTVYDSLGQGIASIDPAGVITRSYFDALGRTTHTIRNLAGQEIDETDPTRPSFDAGHPDQNITTEVIYDVTGSITDQIDNSGVVTHFEYDALQRLTAVIENYHPGVAATTSVNVRTEYTYDARGNRLTIRDAQAVLEERSDVTRFSYDALGRLTQELDPLLHARSYNYDILGNLASTTDAKDATTTSVYDALNRLKTIDYPTSEMDVIFLYNQLDQRTSMMTDGMGITTWGYDGVGRVTAIDDPLNAAVMYDYDAMGNRTKLTYPDGKQLIYVPNALGQIKEVQERIANGWSADQTVHYTYEPNGQLQMAMLPNGVNSYYAYDGVGRLIDLVHESDTANLAEYHYSYDAAGNRVQAVEIVQQPVSTAVPGAPDNLTADQHGYQEMALRWQDHANNETDYLLERSTDGIHWQPVTSLNRDTIRYVDNGLMRHTQYWYRVVGRNGELRAESQASLEVTAFDAVTGAMVQTPGVRVIHYSYDPLKRLTAADYDTGAYYHYAYDSNGNRLQEETHLSITPVMYAYNDSDANRLESVNGVLYTWDDNGNLTSDGQCSYGYDAANRLTGITNCENTASFAYNGLGDRVQETVNGVSNTFALDLAAGLTQVLQDGANTYLYGNGRIMQQSATQTAYFLGDALGSVRQLADASGAVVMAKDYEPYGEVMGSAGTGAASYGFTGEWSSTNLIFLRARYYSGATGRFTSRDSWGGDDTLPMSYNAWLYGYSNPTRYYDRDGRKPCDDFDEYGRCLSQKPELSVPLTNNEWKYLTMLIIFESSSGNVPMDINYGKAWALLNKLSFDIKNGKHWAMEPHRSNNESWVGEAWGQHESKVLDDLHFTGNYEARFYQVLDRYNEHQLNYNRGKDPYRLIKSSSFYQIGETVNKAIKSWLIHGSMSSADPVHGATGFVDMAGMRDSDEKKLKERDDWTSINTNWTDAKNWRNYYVGCYPLVSRVYDIEPDEKVNNLTFTVFRYPTVY